MALPNGPHTVAGVRWAADTLWGFRGVPGGVHVF
jgi:hypothetical protein